MNDVVRSLIALYVFPSGRRVACAEEIAQRAHAAELPSIEHLALALAARERAVRAEHHARKTAIANAKHTSKAVQLDRQVDACFAAMYETAKVVLTTMKEGTPEHAAAERFLAANFPQGLSEVVNQRYHEEAADAAALLARAAAAPAQADIALLGLGMYVKQLAALQPLYAAELGVIPAALPAYQAIVDGYRQCQDQLVDLLIEILATTRTAPDKAAALLEPITFHQGAIARYLRERRQVRDVDPATGAEVDDGAPST